VKKVVFLALFLGFFLAPGQVFSETLTLEEAVKRALANNPDLSARVYEIQAAKHAKQAAQGALLPQIDFSAQASRMSDPVAVVPIKGPGAFPAFSRDIYAAQVEMRLPLYEGGRLRRLVRLSELEAAFRQSLKEQTALDLISNVKETFLFGVYLKSLIEARSKTLEALKREQKEAELKLKLGRLAPLDLLRITTQVKAEEAALVASQEALQRTKEALSVLLGESPKNRFELVGELKAPELLKQTDLDSAISCRPDVVAAARAVAKAKEMVSLERGAHLPQIDLYSSYGRRAGSGFHDSEEVWEAGLRFRLNLFSGGTISARVAEAQARLLAEEEKKRAVVLNAQREVAEALSRLSEAQAQLVSLKEARAKAKEAFRVESLRYRSGAGTVTDMLLAQAAWLEAEAAYLEALYRLVQAQIAYERATATIARGYLKLSCEEMNHGPKN